MNFVLTTVVEMLQKTNSSGFLWLLEMCSNYQYIPTWLTDEWQKIERKRNNLCLSVYIINFSVIGWLMQGSTMSKKICDRILRSCVFSWTPLPWNEAVSILFYLVLDMACLPCTSFESCWTPIYCRFNRIMSQWAMTLQVIEGARKNGHSR